MRLVFQFSGMNSYHLHNSRLPQHVLRVFDDSLSERGVPCREDNEVLKQCQHLCMYLVVDGGPRDYSTERKRPVTMAEMSDIGARQASVRDPTASVVLCKRPP